MVEVLLVEKLSTLSRQDKAPIIKTNQTGFKYITSLATLWDVDHSPLYLSQHTNMYIHLGLNST